MDDSAEGEAVPPGLGEVHNIDAWIFGGGALGPPKEIVLGGDIGLLADYDIGNLQQRKSPLNNPCGTPQV